MIVYSIEISIEKEVHQKWLQWMNEVHIPEVMRTNMFVKFNFYENLEENLMKTYTIQYETDSIEKYLKYNRVFSKKLQQHHNDLFKNKFSSKRALFKKTDLD